nr:hypothetical protein [Clostridia bacterium]
MSKKKHNNKMNYPFSNDIKQLKEEYKKMIDTMPDDEFIEYMYFISSMEEMTDTDYEEMWAEDEDWEDEATKFYKYHGNDNPLDDEDLPF